MRLPPPLDMDDYLTQLASAVEITRAQKPGPHVTRDTCEVCGGQGCPGGCACDCRRCNPPMRPDIASWKG